MTLGANPTNLFSIPVGQDETPHPAPRPMEDPSILLQSLKTMAEEQKQMFKKVRRAVKKTHKMADETKSKVQQEAQA